ncbi:SpoIIE family protein phosphatase [Candidatus Poribacteria bacterium]|nr:SpoIIE family protein phosphatase [Candidatus Poribacteria bacterium]
MTGEKSRTLRRKIVVIFLLIGLVPLFAASVPSFLLSQKALKRAIGLAQRDLAVEVMDKVDREIDNARLLVRNWISIPEILEIVIAGGQRPFEELQMEWHRDGLTSSFGALLLKRLQAITQDRFKEIFVTDTRGYVIAATNKTSDFDQGPDDDPPFGEQWWAAAIRKGEHIGKVSFDQSAEVYSVDINMRIMTSNGRSVGVIKAVYNMENIQNLIGAISKGKTWYYELINRKGLVVGTREAEKERILKEGPSVKIPQPVWKDLSDKNDGVVIGVRTNGKKVLVGWSRGSDNFDGPEWTVLGYLPLEEAYAPLYPQAKWSVAIFLIAFVVILLVSLTLANTVVSEFLHKEVLTQELEVAHDMQMGLLPEAPNIEGLELAGRCITANHVGGDYFNYLWLDAAHTKLAIVIADVAGHDMSAAIPAVMFSGMLEYAVRDGTPGEMLDTLNEVLCRRLRRTPFITCCIGVIDLVHKTLVWSKAGHPGIYHYHSHEDTVVELTMDSYPLGVSSKSRYTTRETGLSVGDLLVFYTDGLVEACNEQEEMYGYDRLAEFVLQMARDSVSSVAGIDKMMAEAHRFIGNQEQGDDIAFVVAKVVR